MPLNQAGLYKVLGWLEQQTGWRAALLCILAGFVTALSLPPFGLWPLLLFSLPCFYNLTQGASSLKGGFARGWCFGFGYFVLTLHWIGFAFLVDASHDLWMMPFAVLGLVALLSLFWGAATLVLRITKFKELSGAMTLAILLALAEHYRGVLFTGFPWGEVGLASLSMGPLAQTASLWGIEGLTFLLLLWALTWPYGLKVCFTPVEGRGSAMERSVSGLLLGTLIIALAYGVAHRALNVTAAPSTAIIRLVQPNIPQSAKWRAGAEQSIFQQLLEQSVQPPAGGEAPPQIIIWPESAAPFLLDEAPIARDEIAAMLGRGRSLITGSLRRVVDPAAGPERERVYNSLFTLDDNGDITGTYDKARLVPGGEFLPFESFLSGLGFRRLVSLPGSFTAGSAPKILTLRSGLKISPSICYEVIFPYGFAPSEERADVLVSITNDGWFGNSIGPHVHLAQARMRSIEQGLPMMRAANTGISAVINSFGDIVAQSPLGDRAIVDAGLPAALQMTMFARHGVMLFWLMIGITTVLTYALHKIPALDDNNG